MGILDYGAGSHPVRVGEITTPATESAAAVTGVCAFLGIIVVTDETNDLTINIYDNTEASGTKLVPTDMIVKAASATWALSIDPGIPCSTGIYVDVTCSGTYAYQVQYDNG